MQVGDILGFHTLPPHHGQEEAPRLVQLNPRAGSHGTQKPEHLGLSPVEDGGCRRMKVSSVLPRLWLGGRHLVPTPSFRRWANRGLFSNPDSSLEPSATPTPWQRSVHEPDFQMPAGCTGTMISVKGSAKLSDRLPPAHHRLHPTRHLHASPRQLGLAWHVPAAVPFSSP